MNKKALIILAEGFEETEAVAPIDILRRAEFDVTVAGLDGVSVKGAHDVTVQADIEFDKYEDMPDVVILPGGMPGASNLAGSSKVKDLILKMNSEGKCIAAICAAPAIVLSPLGILNGKSVTCYPGFEEKLSGTTTYLEDKVVADGNIITSRGPGTAIDFALKIVRCLSGELTAGTVGRQVLHPGA